MPGAPFPAEEAARQRRVKELCVTDDGADRGLQRIVTLAASYFDAPIALISILDDQRQWFKASVGTSLKETPRRDAFCGYTILSKDALVVPDALKDDRFRHNPLVIGPPGIRFYAGTPLVSEDGVALGSLCVIDTCPRPPLTAHELAMLRQFAGLAMGRITSLRDLQYIDQPTGLFNRLRLEADVLLSLEYENELTVVAVDSLSPAFVNEIVKALGYPFFNDLMLEIRHRLQTALGVDHILYKISPTQFGFLLKYTDVEQQRDSYQGILRAFEEPVVCRSIPIHADIGLGVLPLNGTCSHSDEWLRLVVNAASEARERHKGWAYFDHQTDATQRRAFTLLTDLACATREAGQLWLEYQPIVSLRTGACTAVEALLRWKHPTLGPISPAEFIPLAETTALIRPLSQWVLREGISQMARWEKFGYSFQVAINASARDLEGPEYLEMLFALLTEYGVSAGRLKLEFTESALIAEPDEVAARLRDARDKGITIALDDFGAGYSNWSYLRQLPASVIKIDQSFIRNLGLGQQEDRLALTLLEAAKRLGYRVVAEGIETDSAHDLLREWGCDEGQGYLIGRPMVPHLLEQWLAAHPHALPAQC